MTRIQANFHDGKELFDELLKAPKGRNHPFYIDGSCLITDSEERSRIQRAMKARAERNAIPYRLHWFRSTDYAIGIVGVWIPAEEEIDDERLAKTMRKHRRHFDASTERGYYPPAREYTRQIE